MTKRRNPKFSVSNREVEEVEDSHETTLYSAMVAASKAAPIMAPAIRALTPVPTNIVPTMAVDKYFRLYINPNFIDECVEKAKAVSKDNPCPSCNATEHHPISYVAGVICHEAWHPLRDHHLRANNQGLASSQAFYLWNIAADMEINDDLVEVFSLAENVVQLCLPGTVINVKNNQKEGYFMPSTFEFPGGKLVEEYYNLLLDEADKVSQGVCKTCRGTGKKQQDQQDQQAGDKGQDSGGQGENSEQQQGQGQGNEQSEGQSQGQGQGQGQGEDCPDCNGTGSSQGAGDGSGGVPNSGVFGDIWNCGSGADGRERPYEAGPPGENCPVPGISEVEGRMIRKNVAKNIHEDAKSRGNMPGGWQRWADKELEPAKYDWRKEMSKVVRYALGRVTGDQLRTYRRLGRRTASLGGKAILPSHYNPRPRVTIVQDTSGSMSDEAIKMSMSEAESIVRAAGAAIGFIAVDMQADKVQEANNSIRSIQVHGGGGTDMRVGIKAALEADPSPDIIILFTDGFTPWPDAPLPEGKQLVVGLVGEHACDVNETPAWAHTIRIVGDDVIVRPQM